jgi:hypothetical protein
LTDIELEYAFKAIQHHGYSAMLPQLHEWASVIDTWADIKHYLTEIDLDAYTPHKVLKVFAPKSRASIRVVHMLHPEDLLIYTALILIIKNDIEAARISRKSQRSFSYRVNTSSPDRLYNTKGAYESYLQQLDKKAKKPNTKFVCMADIADFYPRIYQHRLENIIESTASTPRGVDVARVLVKKLISKLSDGNSYGIPVGPYASRILGEAILIDVDSQMHSKSIDFVRWVDDYNFFCRTEYSAQSTVFGLAEWLFVNHGLTLQSAKTKILTSNQFTTEILTQPQEHLTDRESIIALLKDSRISSFYEDDEDDEELDEVEVQELINNLRAFDLHGMFVESLSDQSLVDYEVVKYVLTRLPRIPGADEELKSSLLELVLDNVALLYPVAEYVAGYVLSFKNLTVPARNQIAKKLLGPLKSKRNPPPDYYAMWILHIFSTSPDWNQNRSIVNIFQKSNSEIVKRFAALAVAVSGDRAAALAMKDDFATASPLLRLALLSASKKLGKDERKHWRLSHGTKGIVEKYV